MTPGIKETVALLLRYNLWANTAHVEFFKAQPSGVVDAHVPGSFPSVMKTLQHIRNAQQVWLQRLHGESPAGFPVDSAENEVIYGDLLLSSQTLLEYCSGLSDDALNSPMHYTTFAYGAQTSLRYEVLLHVCNHSTYHRGQCVTMARALGLEGIPPTDLIRYLRLA